MSIQTITPAELDSLNTGKVIVDCYSDRCGPCRALEPILGQLTDVKILKINIDTHPDFATEHKVDAIPALFFYKDGNMVEQMKGLQSLETLQEKVNNM